ncbi:hypothetical protein NHP21005_01120 [Helicobacter sp. NHP21005]|uniref:hypothetical protein n=1 Tax=Helicobacter felistomachi TaxID=3040201 RepID=UPI002573527D|nr:hypothetical protein [Helicobacter sp. NHP21005]BEG56424.1 hypothetical protein NHP21005_01120 [Helicobacter sp. NHP21005]
MNEEEKSKKLDETLAFLAQKGMATIAQDTKLSNPKIKAILEKDFDSVQRVHAVGFVQILEKEYGVDLSQWLVEYDQNLFGAKKESGLSKEPSQGKPGILKAQEIQEEEKQKSSKPDKAKPTKSKQESQEPPKNRFKNKHKKNLRNRCKSHTKNPTNPKRLQDKKSPTKSKPSPHKSTILPF